MITKRRGARQRGGKIIVLSVIGLAVVGWQI
jgi:hypothetical protein